jgi:ribosomal protein L11 methyltransferase
LYPALDVGTTDLESLLVLVDDVEPTAAEERDASVVIYFSNADQRDRARNAVAAAWPATPLSVRDVDDEDWAARSQRNLTAVTVGRVTIAPPWAVADTSTASTAASHSGTQPVAVIVQPSMGFGTGHHATTRLCVKALQTIDLEGRTILDVGTGSGVLAMAASRLGAGHAVGIDNDPDAVHAARENLPLNPDLGAVTFCVSPLESLGRDRPADPALATGADVVTANLTGALLVRSAAVLLGAVRPGGSIIVSGLLEHERDDVVAAFAPAVTVWEASEEGWVGLAFHCK